MKHHAAAAAAAAAASSPQTHLRDFAVWLVAFLATLFLGIELGLAAAIGLALLIVIFESAFPHTAVLGRVDRTTVRQRQPQRGQQEQRL
jgi:sulfate transporter 4